MACERKSTVSDVEYRIEILLTCELNLRTSNAHVGQPLEGAR